MTINQIYNLLLCGVIDKFTHKPQFREYYYCLSGNTEEPLMQCDVHGNKNGPTYPIDRGFRTSDAWLPVWRDNDKARSI